MNIATTPDAATTFTQSAGLSTGPVSAEPYRSPEYFELERERVFGRAWLILGRVEEIPNLDDFIVRDIDTCRASVLITRGRSGVQAFHNVCSHRNNQLVWEPFGNAKLMRCRYHSWVFRNDGSLATVPAEKSFFDFDKAKCGLTAIATEVWDGWIFINLERKPSVSLKEFLGDFGNYLKGIPYSNVEDPVIMGGVFNCNWKVLSDAFVEAYHVGSIHSKTIAGIFASSENPHSNVLDARFFGPHSFTSMYGNPDYVPGKNKLLERALYSSMVLGGPIAASNSDNAEAFRAHPAVNPTRTEKWSMDANFFFPNFHLDTISGGFVTHQFWPITYNKTRYEYKVYLPKADSMRALIQQQHFIANTMETILEDLGNVERSQIGLESRGKDFLYLQDNEVLIRHAVDQIDRWVRSDSAASALEVSR